MRPFCTIFFLQITYVVFRLLEDKVQEAEQSKLEALERCRLRGLALKVEDNRPTLVNLCEDPQLSQTLLYNLKKGPTTFGTSNADVTLSGLHDTDIHWYVSFTLIFRLLLIFEYYIYTNLCTC